MEQPAKENLLAIPHHFFLPPTARHICFSWFSSAISRLGSPTLCMQHNPVTFTSHTRYFGAHFLHFLRRLLLLKCSLLSDVNGDNQCTGTPQKDLLEREDKTKVRSHLLRSSNTRKEIHGTERDHLAAPFDLHSRPVVCAVHS